MQNLTKKKAKVQAWTGSEGSRRLRLPCSHISRRSAHGGGNVSLTYRETLPPGNIPGTHLYWRLSRHQGHSAAGRIMSMKNSNDTIGNRTRDLQACSPVPQPTALQAHKPNRSVQECLYLADAYAASFGN